MKLDEDKLREILSDLIEKTVKNLHDDDFVMLELYATRQAIKEIQELVSEGA